MPCRRRLYSDSSLREKGEYLLASLTYVWLMLQGTGPNTRFLL